MGKLREFLGLIVFSGLFLTLLYKSFYANGGYVLGAEGAYYLDAILLAKNYGYLWYNAAVGYIATSYNFVFHLILIQWLFNSVRLVNYVTIAMLYVLPFIAMYLLCLELKLRPYPTLVFSIFYLTNPFTAYFLLSINQWNMIATYILPAFFLIILKFYDRPLSLFTIFGFHSLLFAYANANPPTMVIYQIAIVIFIIIISVSKTNRLCLKDIIYHHLLVLLSFILFNFWWIANWVFAMRDANANYTVTYALGWLKSISNEIPVVWRSFSLSSLLPFPHFPEQDFFTAYFGNRSSEIIFILPMLLVVLTLFKTELMRLHLKLLGIFLVIVGLLAKGVNHPFGYIYEFAIVNVPLFKIFKTAPEKWGILFVFLLTLYLILSFRDISQSFLSRVMSLSLSLYCLYTVVPFITGNFLPDYFYHGSVRISKHFLYKKEYLDLKNTLNRDTIQYRVLSLPGHLNYQVALRTDEGKLYGGGDPILTNTNKPFIATYNNLFTRDFLVLFDNISSPVYSKMLSLYNIKKVVINKDLFPWFGFREKEDLKSLERIFSDQFLSTKNEVIDLYDVGESFIPRIYIANQIIRTDLPHAMLANILLSEEPKNRPAIFFSDRNNRDNSLPIEIDNPNFNIPKLTFKKVNPTKYKLSIEDIRKPFLLVFSENFHSGWRLYMTNERHNINETDNRVVGRYFDGEIRELAQYINFFDRKPTETWFRSPIAQGHHYVANGYANSWLITPEDIGMKEDVELIIDYWPQRIFYLGVFVSLITIVITLTLLLKFLVNIKK